MKYQTEVPTRSPCGENHMKPPKLKMLHISTRATCVVTMITTEIMNDEEKLFTLAKYPCAATD